MMVDAECTTWNILKQQRSDTRQCRRDDDVHRNSIGRTSRFWQTLTAGWGDCATENRGDATGKGNTREANICGKKLGVPRGLRAEGETQSDCKEAQTRADQQWLCRVDQGEHGEGKDDQPDIAEQVGSATSEVVRDDAADERGQEPHAGCGTDAQHCCGAVKSNGAIWVRCVRGDKAAGCDVTRSVGAGKKDC